MIGKNGAHNTRRSSSNHSTKEEKEATLVEGKYRNKKSIRHAKSGGETKGTTKKKAGVAES